MSPFAPASRHQVKARIALAGPSGSGKSFTGLAVASALAEDGKLAVIDTEKGSASLYADKFSFDVMELGPPFAPERFVQAIHDAERAGYAALLIDSLSHAWFAQGGVLEIVDQAAKRLGGNSYAGWAVGTPAHNSLIDAIVRADLHVVATMRSKTAYVLEEQRGRQVPRKVGMEPVQRDSVDYEFTVFGSLDLEHTLTITKSRFESLQDQVFPKPGAEFGTRILAELRTGEEGGGAVQDASPPTATAEQVAQIIERGGAVLGFEGEELRVKLVKGDRSYDQLSIDEARKVLAHIESKAS